MKEPDCRGVVSSAELKKLLPRISITFIIFVFLFSALAGCSKSCDEYDKDLRRYAEGSVPKTETAGLTKECKDALSKCPNLSSPYEIMGDLELQNRHLKEALENYEKALERSPDNARLKDKINSAPAALVESIKNITLASYAAIDAPMRRQLCEAAIEATIESNRHMAEGPGGTRKVTTEIPPEQLDEQLLQAGTEEPVRLTGDAIWGILVPALKVAHE